MSNVMLWITSENRLWYLLTAESILLFIRMWSLFMRKTVKIFMELVDRNIAFTNDLLFLLVNLVNFSTISENKNWPFEPWLMS